MSNGDNEDIVDDVVDAADVVAHYVVGLARTGSGPAATVSVVCAVVQHFIIS